MTLREADGERVLPGICRIVLVGLAISWVVASGCDFASRFNTDVVDVRLLAENRSWHASYLLAGAPGAPGAPIELPTGREVHVPQGARVHLLLRSRDFVSDFRVIELALRDFATPYLPAEMSFRADRPGRYEVRGDEMCGLPHTDRTRGWLVVEDATAYRSWIGKRLMEEKQ